MSLQHSPRIITDGLVLCLDAANKRSYPGSGDVWTDLAGSNNGALTNGPTFSSANGGSIVFDGSDDYVLVSNNVNPPNITLDFFYKAFDDSAYEYLISNARDCCGEYKGYELVIYGGRPLFRIWNTTSQEVINYGLSPITFGKIYHISATYDGTQIKLYQNGLHIGTTNTSLGIGSPPSYNLAIGGMGIAPSVHNIRGNIFSAKIYNRALSPTEILQNYNALKGRYNL